jgi:molybdenum cofactor cytidylyltransferase
LIVPSFERRRGHPWLVRRTLWHELLALESPASPRDFQNAHAAEIHYVNVETPTILADLDTPEDYRKAHP